MKKLVVVSISAGLMLATPFVSAEETLPLKAVNRAGEVIDAALEAYGGAETITNLNSVARKSHFTTWATNQSRSPGPPWDENEQMSFSAIDFENETFVGKNKGSGNGFDFNGSQIIKGEEGWQVSYRAGTVTPIAEPDFNTTSGPFIRVTAPLLVKQLQNRRQTSHWLGEVEFEGRPHDVITLVMEVGPALSLYFDQETHLLSRSERVLPPFGQVDYRFTDYETVDGIPFSKTFKLYVNDEPNIVIDIKSTKVNASLDKYAAVPQDLKMVEAAPPAPTDVEVQEIKEGVFLVGAGNTYAMFVEMNDHIVAVGGTAGIPERIKALREVVKDKPIKYGVMTHHHNDHVLGVPAYQGEDAVVLTVKENEAVMRAAATDADSLKLQFVEDKYVFDDGSQKLEIIDIGPTPHVEHLLVAWLPEEGILFEADHFPNPTNGQMAPAQPVTKRLAEAIDQKGMDVKIIVGSHSPRIASMDDLRRALALSPVKIAQASR
ncbi:MAG: MBL fold metallo-hydrolase [Xanthomonadales bacterium]|nr:MBL fold metallo-hydrolase [Xanthomonadales bacterium]